MLPSPLNLPLRHLSLELDRLSALIAVRAAELRALGLLPQEGKAPPPLQEEPGGEVQPTWTSELEAAEAHALTISAALEALLAEVPRAVLPLCILEDRFGLDAEELLLLLLAAAPLFDPSMGRRYALLYRQPQQTWPSVSLLQELASGAGIGPELPRLLDPDAPLIRYRLLGIQRAFPDLPMTWQPLSVDSRLARFLRGELVPDPDLSACVTLLHELPPARDRLFLPEAEREPWAQLLEAAEAASSEPLLLIFRGPEGIGRRRRALEVARQAGRVLLCADLTALMDLPGGLIESMRLVRREALLQDAHLALTGWERLLAPRGEGDEPGSPQREAAQRERVVRELGIGLRGHAHPVALLLESGTPAPRLPGVRSLEYAPKPLDRETALRLWRFVLPRTLRHASLDLDAVAATYQLTPGQIHDATEESRAASAATGAVHANALRAAIKHGIAHRLGDNARLVERAWSWEDLILTNDVLLQIQEFVHRFRYRDQVLTDWGLGRRFGDARGLSALFEGPPGTGKTMSASVVARDLGLDLYQVDLSRIVSRYIGETEKNLGRVFDEAELAQSMLLFDEADALFAKRTEVKSSNDRYANMEVNYLLQRLESFTGVVILTTNFGASIDDAFARRLSLRVTFPNPGAPEREALWRSMLCGDGLPLGKVDFSQLAEVYELAGGHIRNAVLRAAFLAAARGVKLDNHLLETAARLEMRSQGMLVFGDD